VKFRIAVEAHLSGLTVTASYRNMQKKNTDSWIFLWK